MKKFAWTMAELMIAMTILIILCGLSTSLMKNIEINKSRIFVYVTIKNLSKGHVGILESNDDSNFYPSDAETSDADTTVTDDWYCMQMANLFSTTNTPNCKKNAANKDVNFITGNGVYYQGLSTPWQLAYGSLYYKNIVIDVNGEEGANKVGIDRFPLRVFRGKSHNDKKLDGLIYPVNCANDVTYDGEYNSITLTTPYCNDGFDANKTNKKVNFALDDEILAQDVYRAQDETKPTQATIVLGNLSTMAADCRSYGGWGFYNKKECFDAGFVIDPKCAHDDVCKQCAEDYNVCPNSGTEDECKELAKNYILNAKDEDDPSKTNEVSIPCVHIMSKPTKGLGMIGGLVVSEMGI